MRRVSWLIFSVLGAVSFLVFGTMIVRSDWAGQSTGQALASVTGTGFTYQGHLVDGDGPADGRYDFVFRLYDHESGGLQVGPAITTT
ncbi:MAG: hypothetical protein PVJ75_12470, partial [Chloroflexota bacterium]